MKSILKIAIFFIGFFAIAQQTPAPIQSEVITIVGATAHIGNGTVIEIQFSFSKTEKLQQLVMKTKLP